ncbi:MAG: hypothetical protein E7403_07000 [Ruminococcaceae bacterium]|nr:hypothetical protein [Oscillospiraceae bacterium]
MITIKKIEDMNEINAYLQVQGFNHTFGMEQFMGMYDGDRLIGLGSIELCVTKVYLNFIHTEENTHAFNYGLAKSLLNMADLSGVKTVYGNNPDLNVLYMALRFVTENDEYMLSLEGYFTEESCH